MLTTSFTKKFSDIKACDVIAVGSKNAILGDIYSQLSSQGVHTPNGFAVTSFAFEHFLTANALHQRLYELMNELDQENYSNLQSISARARAMILQGSIPYFVIISARDAYEELCNKEEKSIAVAVRSSVSAENLPLASFAGLHQSFLNIDNEDSLLDAIKKCFASLYSDHAIKYRVDNHFTHAKLFFSVGIQKMVHSQNGCFGSIVEDASGSTLDISATACLHTTFSQPANLPDRYLVSISGLMRSSNAIIKKSVGKNPGMHVTESETQIQTDYVLTDTEITTLAQWASIINKHFGKQMDIEWIKDGRTGELYIVRAKPAMLAAHEKQPPKQKYYAPVKSLIPVARKAVFS